MINKTYKKTGVIAKLHKVYKINVPTGIQLNDFLEISAYQKLLESVKDANLKKKEIRDMYSYFEAKAPALRIFRSPDFLSFMSLLTGEYLTKTVCSLQMFMHGCYSLLHDDKKEELNFFIDVTPRWDAKHGGMLMAVAGDDTVPLPSLPNSLVLVDAHGSYVKFVNHKAGSAGHVFVAGTLR